MSLNKKFKTNADLEKDGVKVEYEENGEVIAWLKCRRPGGRNRLYQKALSRKLRENRQALAADHDGTLDARILAEVYAESIVVDWGGDIEGPDGSNPCPCTFENVVWLFIEEAPDLFIDLQNRLTLRSNWQDREDEAKNSKTVSSTNSAGGRKEKK